MKKIAFLLSGAAAAALLFNSCGGSYGDSNGGGGAPGPASAASFAGTTISFDPSVTFSSGGVISYVNDDSTSLFPYALTPVAGTYSYSHSNDFRSGALTYQIEGEEETTAFLSEFVVKNGFVTSFTIRFPDEGTFNATVSGQLIAVRESTGDDGSGDGTLTGGENFSYQANGNISSGASFTKTYLSGTTQGQAYYYTPLRSYAPSQAVQFGITVDGSLAFSGRYEALYLPFTSASGGVITYQGDYYGGTVVAVFDTNPTSEASDLSITWTDSSYVFDYLTDTRRFAN